MTMKKGSKNNLVRKFVVLTNSLTKQELLLISKLEKAVEAITAIYYLQIKGQQQGTNFYPKNISREEIIKASKNDPAILDPYTVVEIEGGKLKAIPYHKKFEKELKVVSSILDDAAMISSDKAFSKYLRVCSDVLVSGKYEKMHSTWMYLKSNINFVIGPIEYYDDDLFSKKRSYQASVGVINQEKTAQAKHIKDILYINAKDNITLTQHSIIAPERIQVVAEDTIAIGGFLSKVLFSGEYFPNDFNLLHKDGVKIVFYYPSMKLKFDKLHYPIFKAIFAKEFQQSYSRELLMEATFLYIVLYELARQLHHFNGADERLQDLFPTFDEGNTSVAAISHCKYLLTKGVIDQKMLEALMVVHICWMFSDWITAQNIQAMTGYVKGSTIVLNFYFQSGALHEAKGISWPNFPKMFFEIERLSDILARMLMVGNRQQANEFIRTYGSQDYFKRFSAGIKGIHLL